MILSKKMSYLCIMKNENDMDMIFAKHGFLPGEEPNEYIRDTWTIRLVDQNIEVFNADTDKNPVYVSGNLTMINLISLFEEIDYLSNH